MEEKVRMAEPGLSLFGPLLLVQVECRHFREFDVELIHRVFANILIQQIHEHFHRFGDLLPPIVETTPALDEVLEPVYSRFPSTR